MSRRTKLIFLVIFGVLLAVPIVYLALAWHPASPLTFHLEEAEPTVKDNNTLGSYRARHIRIENASFTPIEFHGAVILSTSGVIAFRDGPPGMVLAESATRSGPDTHVLVIPGHGRLIADALLGPELLPEVPDRKVFVQYQWHSQPRRHADSALRWLKDNVPVWASPHIHRPSLWENAVPLEPASPTQ